MNTERVSISTLTQEQCRRSLRSSICPACGKPKQPHKSLCGGDYAALPPYSRSTLYNKIGKGYEASFADALEVLKRPEAILPAPAARPAGSGPATEGIQR